MFFVIVKLQYPVYRIIKYQTAPINLPLSVKRSITILVTETYILWRSNQPSTMLITFQDYYQKSATNWILKTLNLPSLVIRLISLLITRTIIVIPSRISKRSQTTYYQMQKISNKKSIINMGIH